MKNYKNFLIALYLIELQCLTYHSKGAIPLWETDCKNALEYIEKNNYECDYNKVKHILHWNLEMILDTLKRNSILNPRFDEEIIKSIIDFTEINYS